MLGMYPLFLLDLCLPLPFLTCNSPPAIIPNSFIYHSRPILFYTPHPPALYATLPTPSSPSFAHALRPMKMFFDRHTRAQTDADE